jgi:hypothetical protein
MRLSEMWETNVIVVKCWLQILCNVRVDSARQRLGRAYWFSESGSAAGCGSQLHRTKEA